MKPIPWTDAEPFRWADRPGFPPTKPGDDYGFFVIPSGSSRLLAMVSCGAGEGEGWDHVSVSVFGEKRCPTWDEMCRIKGLFWGDDEWVVQYHPAASDYVNVHKFCLHLWRPFDGKMPRPPSWMVGPK